MSLFSLFRNQRAARKKSYIVVAGIYVNDQLVHEIPVTQKNWNKEHARKEFEEKVTLRISRILRAPEPKRKA